MNINVRAINHEHSQKLQVYYEELLNKDFSKLTFLSRVELHINGEADGSTEMGLELFPRGGNPLFVSHTDPIEAKAYKGVTRKMKVKIEKYKNLIVQNHKIK